MNDIVNKILSYDQLHDLWGAGYTIVKRNSDPFEIDPKLIPRGMSYQWNPIQPDVGVKVVADGDWKPVPFSRHEGVFAPWGMKGDVYRDGLGLFEKPKTEVEHQLERTRTRALQNVDDWATRNAALGITGFTRVGGDMQVIEPGGFKELKLKPGEKVQDALDRLNVTSDFVVDGDMAQVGATKTIETVVAIPRDMTPHIASIFKERDRLEAEVVRKDRTLVPGEIADKFYAAVDADKGAPWWPTLRAILLPIAIENVRASLPKGPKLTEVLDGISKLKKDTTDE